jgi:hypothetical protein
MMPSQTVAENDYSHDEGPKSVDGKGSLPIKPLTLEALATRTQTIRRLSKFEE